MSTPNAGGIAWLLGQHKAQLGIRVVDEVGIFSTGKPGGEVPNLYFHIIAGPLVEGQDR